MRIIKTTLLGGITLLVPLAILVMVLVKVYTFLQRLLHPVLKQFTDTNTVTGYILHEGIALIVLLLICFGAGLLIRTKPARQLINWLEQGLLSKIPGYRLIKNMGLSIAGVEEKDMQVVLVWIDETWQLSFLVEQINENIYTVFVPQAPNPFSGTVYHLDKNKIKWTDMNQRQAITCIRQLGYGSAAALQKGFSTGSVP